MSCHSFTHSPLTNVPQSPHQRLRPLSYAKSHVIIIAFSLDTPDSLDNVSSKWIEEVRQLCGPSIPVLLVGCKKDLRDQAGPGGAPGFVSTEQVRRGWWRVFSS